MTAFYSEWEKYPAQWTRNLIEAGHIAPGVVDERSISDLSAEDVRGFDQAHFFAGYGTWSHALRLAGWDDCREIWTGSCPCQPWSQAGRGKGVDDERHLWPTWFELIRAHRPETIMGEQVGSPAGLKWLDLVFDDLEGEGYTCWAADLPAASVGAPHIRQRIYFVAFRLADNDGVVSHEGREVARRSDHRGNAQPRAGSRGGGFIGAMANNNCERLEVERLFIRERRSLENLPEASGSGEVVSLGDSDSSGVGQHVGKLPSDEGQHVERPAHGNHPSLIAGATGELGYHHHQGLAQQRGELGVLRKARRGDAGQAIVGAGTPVGGFWNDAEWTYCKDEKYRPFKSGSFPLVDGTGGRVALVRTRGQPGSEVQETRFYNRTGALKAIGNAIVPQVAATFIRAFIECTQHL